MSSSRIARNLALPLAALSMLAATALAQPTGKAAIPASPPPPGGTLTGTPTTGVCAQGFSKIAEVLYTGSGGNGNLTTGGAAGAKYNSYTCSGNAPMCLEQKAAAEQGPKLQTVAREGGSGGLEGGGGTNFVIRANYEVKYNYNCGLPAHCLSAASQGATGVSVEVNRGFIGNTVNYKCTYPRSIG